LTLVLLKKIYIFTVPYFIMVTKKFLLLVTFLLLCTNLLLAATFTVTSNADAGPGTLREALSNAAANGITIQDIIKFNLPGSLVSDRIIRLKTELPSITSNIIIDGTTQPSIPFGVSDARVILEPESSPVTFSGLYVSGNNNTGSAAKNIEIYGLYIRNFAKITNLANQNINQGSGIVLPNDASFITIGAPGKGNVISGNIHGVVNSEYYNYYSGSKEIVIQSNIIGLLDDGFTAGTNMYGIRLSVDNNARIGGANANMGNVISANVYNISITHENFVSAANLVNIQNNKIGTNYNGDADYKNIPLFQLSAFIQTFGIYINASGLIARITDNIVSGQRYCGVYVENATFEIEGNKIGTDKAGTDNLGNGEGIRIGTNATGNVGGTAAAAKNIIAYNNYGIETINNTHALISRNSIFCNTDYGISVTSYYYQVPFVKVIDFSGTKVSGVATPNSKIELFYADDCGINCQGKTYITTVTSNGSGAWTYSGTITKPVIATATDGNNNTSPFSSLVISDSDIEIKQLTCAYNGSITIKPAFTGLLFHWDKKELNGTLTPKGDTKNLTNLQPGTYQLTVQYPGGCQKTIKLFEIKDQRVKIQNTIPPPPPECRQKFFPVDVNYQGGTGNVTFTWKNAAGEIKSTNKQGIVPGGTYTLTIADDAGCSVTSAPFTITPKPGPDYDENTAVIKPARCGEQNGSITGIVTYVGIGTLSYKWYNQAGVVVGHDKDLKDKVSGLYTLEVIDQSQCSPYKKNPFFIPEVNSVTITGGDVTPITCNNPNGAITGVQVSSNVDFVQWYDPNGNTIPTTLSNYHNLPNLTAGTYRLYARYTTIINGVTYVCDLSRYFPVNVIPPETFSYAPSTTATTCELNNGAIKLQFNGTIVPQSYQWIDVNGTPQNNSNSNQIADLAPGFYSVKVTDKYGCPSTLGPFEVKKTPLLVFDAANNPTPTPDQCNQKLGHIDGIAVTGGIAPYNYKWTDEATGQQVGGNTQALNVIGKGTYSVVITDATPCAIPLKVEHIEVDNLQFIPNAPVLTDRRICSPETVNLAVLNPITGNYNLYADNDPASTPLQSNSRGSFNVAVGETKDYYVSYNIGTCESLRTKVHVEVILVDVKFGNAFTPNEDGTNDYWNITGLQKFPGSVVKVYTRAGQKVFESKDYATPFTGKNNSTVLPAGVYYYIINLNTPCELLSGTVTIIR
jgi:gliding motility-associated-like protein